MSATHEGRFSESNALPFSRFISLLRAHGNFTLAVFGWSPRGRVWRMKMHTAFQNSIRVLTSLAALTGVPDLPASQVLTLLHIADRGEMPLGDLERLTGVTQSSVSRNVARLGPGRNPDDPGFGLVDLFEDPYYRRRKLVRLNAKGKQLMTKLEGMV